MQIFLYYKSISTIVGSGGARVFTQGGHDIFLGGATYVFEGETEPAK